MDARFPFSLRRLAASGSLAYALVCATAADPAAAATAASDVDTLREQYPVGSIDSVARADAALGKTAGAKAQVEKDFKATARACVKTILVNDCIDRARLLQQKRLADIDAVELEANRYKRRDHADKLEADRAQREGERQAKAPADAEQRAKNRKAFEDRQAQATRDVADRKASADKRAQSPPRKPVARQPQASQAPEIAAAQRAKNATDYAAKVKEASEHEDAIQRHLAAKAADRKRRADAKAAKDALAAARVAPAPGPSPAPVASPKS